MKRRTCRQELERSPPPPEASLWTASQGHWALSFFFLEASLLRHVQLIKLLSTGDAIDCWVNLFIYYMNQEIILSSCPMMTAVCFACYRRVWTRRHILKHCEPVPSIPDSSDTKGCIAIRNAGAKESVNDLNEPFAPASPPCLKVPPFLFWWHWFAPLVEDRIFYLLVSKPLTRNSFVVLTNARYGWNWVSHHVEETDMTVVGSSVCAMQLMPNCVFLNCRINIRHGLQRNSVNT